MAAQTCQREKSAEAAWKTGEDQPKTQEAGAAMASRLEGLVQSELLRTSSAISRRSWRRSPPEARWASRKRSNGSNLWIQCPDPPVDPRGWHPPEAQWFSTKGRTAQNALQWVKVAIHHWFGLCLTTDWCFKHLLFSTFSGDDEQNWNHGRLNLGHLRGRHNKVRKDYIKLIGALKHEPVSFQCGMRNPHNHFSMFFRWRTVNHLQTDLQKRTTQRKSGHFQMRPTSLTSQGVCGLLWCGIFLLFGSNTPADHGPLAKRPNRRHLTMEIGLHAPSWTWNHLPTTLIIFNFFHLFSYG